MTVQALQLQLQGEWAQPLSKFEVIGSVFGLLQAPSQILKTSFALFETNFLVKFDTDEQYISVWQHHLRSILANQYCPILGFKPGTSS